MKPSATVVYWLDDANANDLFCEEIVLFSIGQYSNLTLSAFILHSCKHPCKLLVIFGRFCAVSGGRHCRFQDTMDVSRSISLVKPHNSDARIGFVLGTTIVPQLKNTPLTSTVKLPLGTG